MLTGLMMGLFTVPAVHAFGGLLLLDPVPTDHDRVAVGLSAWSLPRAPGSAQQRLWLLPGIDFYGTSGVFLSTDYGLGWNLSRDDHWQVGARLAPYFGRSHRDARAEGMPDAAIGTRLEHGLFCNYAPNDAMLLQSAVRHGMGRRQDSLLLETGVTSGLPLPGGELLGITAGATWSNGRYKADYLGRPADSSFTATARSQAGGWHDLQLALSYEHKFSETWRLDAQWLDARLVGAAGRSERVQSRYQRQLSVGLWHALR